MEIVVQIIGMTFVCVIMMCIGWTIVEYIFTGFEKPGKQNKKLKLGICGEHGGDPKSIHFCAKIGLNYVSCSPFRIPIARLAAAQAALLKK